VEKVGYTLIGAQGRCLSATYLQLALIPNPRDICCIIRQTRCICHDGTQFSESHRHGILKCLHFALAGRTRSEACAEGAEAAMTAMGPHDRNEGMCMDARAFAGDFLFSTGPNTEVGGSRETPRHMDIPLRNRDVLPGNQPVVLGGKVVAPLDSLPAWAAAQDAQRERGRCRPRWSRKVVPS
jgi:hypothetical protein